MASDAIVVSSSLAGCTNSAVPVWGAALLVKLGKGENSGSPERVARRFAPQAPTPERYPFGGGSFIIS